MIAARRLAAAGAALAGSLVLLAPGCGYKLAGGNTFLPERVRSIMLSSFENRTTRPGIEQRVTEGVALELSKRGHYKVVSGKAGADALLEGAITEFRTTPVQFNPAGRATRMEVVVTIQATLRDLSSEKVLWSQSGLVFREQYDVLNEVLDERQALDTIAEGASQALVTSMFEGF